MRGTWRGRGAVLAACLTLASCAAAQPAGAQPPPSNSAQCRAASGSAFACPRRSRMLCAPEQAPSSASQHLGPAWASSTRAWRAVQINDNAGPV